MWSTVRQRATCSMPYRLGAIALDFGSGPCLYMCVAKNSCSHVNCSKIPGGASTTICRAIPGLSILGERAYLCPVRAVESLWNLRTTRPPAATMSSRLGLVRFRSAIHLVSTARQPDEGGQAFVSPGAPTDVTRATMGRLRPVVSCVVGDGSAFDTTLGSESEHRGTGSSVSAESGL